MTSAGSICPVCESAATLNGIGPLNQVYRVDCSRCGSFKVQDMLVELGWGRVDRETRLRASSWIREFQPNEVLTSDRLESIALVPRPAFWPRAERLLLKMRDFASPSGKVKLEGPMWEAVAWAAERGETNLLLQALSEANFIESIRGAADSFRIRPKGWMHLDAIGRVGTASAQGFVAMWFGDEVARLWTDGLEPAIRLAGWEPHRVDRREFEGKVDDQIIAGIRRSRFVVADCTGNRGGVYFEAGFAQGLGLPVYWTCRSNEMAQVHFDTNHYRFTLWDEAHLARFVEELQRRIEADIGRGPRSWNGQVRR